MINSINSIFPTAPSTSVRMQLILTTTGAKLHEYKENVVFRRHRGYRERAGIILKDCGTSQVVCDWRLKSQHQGLTSLEGGKVQGPSGRLVLFVPACEQRQVHSCSSCGQVYIQSSVRNDQDGLCVKMSPQIKRRHDLIWALWRGNESFCESKTKQTSGRW